MKKPSDFSQSDLYTFIVVGSGTAGMMLVHELAVRNSCNSAVSILLVERGLKESDQLRSTRQPNLWGAAASSSSASTELLASEVQPDLFGRSVLCPVGRGAGGSSNINAMIWTPGTNRLLPLLSYC